MTAYPSIAGIGSRETPPHILAEMTKIGAWCRTYRILVRSGHAEGADYAFEAGALDWCLVYLPWRTFNSAAPVLGQSVEVKSNDKLNELVWKYHPKPKRLTYNGHLLMRRNGAQILGYDEWPQETFAEAPVRAVVCYTTDGQDSGGTGQALRIARGETRARVMNMHSPLYATAAQVIAELERLVS